MSGENDPGKTVNEGLNTSSSLLFGSADYGDSSLLTNDQRTQLQRQLDPQNLALIYQDLGSNPGLRQRAQQQGMNTAEWQTFLANEAIGKYMQGVQALVDSQGPVGAYARNFVGTQDFSSVTGAMASIPGVEPYIINAATGVIRDRLGKLQTSVQEGAGRTPGVIDTAIARATTGATALDPANNPYLQPFAEMGAGAAGGNLQNQWGRGGAEAAGTAVAGAGQSGLDQAGQSYGKLMGQGQQFGQDLGVIRDTAMGRGPSASAILGQKMIDDSSRAMAAQAATARGGNLGSANRAAILGGQQTMLQGAQQIAAQRAQEQLGAQALLNSGNAQLGTLYNQAGALGNTTANTDITRQTNSADALTRTYGTTAQGAIAGMGAVGQAVGDYASGVQAKEDAEGARLALPGQLLTSTYGTATGGASSIHATDTNATIERERRKFEKEQADRNFYTNLATGAVNAASTGAASLLK